MNLTIHPTVLDMLSKMYDSEELHSVVFNILLEFAQVELQDGQYPFMVFCFDDEPVLTDVANEKVPQTFFLN